MCTFVSGFFGGSGGICALGLNLISKLHVITESITVFKISFPNNKNLNKFPWVEGGG
jgi:hypothetical protein